MKKTVNTSDGKKTFRYNNTVKGGIKFTLSKRDIEKNQKEFNLNYDFNDCNIRFFATGLGSVIVTPKPEDGMNIQLMVDEDSNLSDVEDIALQNMLIEAFSLKEARTLKDLIR